ncbi:hypothetical protein Tco_1473286, partial [Tanacetum coccineum]
IMPPKAMSEARMREVIREPVATSMAEFMANMNREAGSDEAGGAGASGRVGGVGAGGTGASGAGAGGAGAGGAEAGSAGAGSSEPATPKITGCTYVTFMKCNPQPFKVIEGAMGLCRALTWWNGRIASMGIDAANGTPWTEVRKWMIEEFCPRSVSNLKKCLSDEDLIIPLDEVRIDEKLHFIEEPIEIMDREVKQLKQSRIPIVKVRWNSSRGPEYTR